MNKKALILMMLFTLVLLSACSSNPQSPHESTNTEVAASSAESVNAAKETDSTFPTSSFEPVESPAAETEVSESPVTEAPSESPAEVSQQTTAERPTTTEQQVSKPIETEKPSEPPVSKPTEPVSTAEPPQTTPPEAPQEPEPTQPPAPSFDVSSYVSYAKSYGQSIGLTLDSTATGCWDTPTEANANCQYIERDLRDLLDWYKDSGFTAFWVWAEETGSNQYNIFVGYA